MSYSSDAAEQVVRMTLEGTEVAIRVAGEGAKKMLALMLAILTDQKKTAGKVWLSTMLKNGNELKVIAVKDSEIATFTKEAGKFGVQFAVLKDRDANDGITDVLVNTKDIALISRVFDRFKLTHVNINSVGDTLKENKEHREPGKTLTPNEALDDYINTILPKKNMEAEKINPTDGLTAKYHQLRPTSKETSAQALSDAVAAARPSVKKEIDKLVKEDGAKPEKTRGKSKGKSHSAKVRANDKGAR